eukprot:COSAG06_NODE_26893_length_605_cov_0.928854_1_plen_28_part_01
MSATAAGGGKSVTWLAESGRLGQVVKMA